MSDNGHRRNHGNNCTHTPDQLIAKVPQGQKLLNVGHPMIEAIMELQITEATWDRRLNQYGSVKKGRASKRIIEWERKTLA